MSKAPFSFVAPSAPRVIPALSSDQKSAVIHRGSALVIHGGPGTGKTTVLIEAALSRIAQGQNPDSILLLTFGRERASELRDAIALRTSKTMFEPLARTFHSLAFSIIKMKAKDDPEPILLSGPEQESYIKELLQGDIADGYKEWPEDLHAALTTNGFARELRDLILRASERGIGPDDLEKLGTSEGEKYWLAAAKFWKRYLNSMVMREISATDAKLRIDPSELVSRAAIHLHNNPDVLSALRARFTTIMVDEFQESDPAQRALLAMLTGTDVIIAADADSAVGRFRGADPDGLSAALDPYRSKEIVLNTGFRNSSTIFDVGLSFAKNMKGSQTTRKRSCGNENKGQVQVHRFRSGAEEAAFIAHQFRSAHLREGISYSNMAVILRSPGIQASSLRRAFSQVGIPVASELQALAGNPAIAPFLLLARVALKQQQLNFDTAERLLMSEFGGADSISLRRIRRALIAARSDGDDRTGTQLLIAALDSGELFIEGATEIVRVHELLEKARAVARNKKATADELLWAIWDNAVTSDGAKLASTWRNQALRPGVRGAAADRDLDAMMQLFESAARYSERFPLSGPGAFIAEIATEDIAGDVITAKGVRPDFVEILTVHSAKGREWDLVAIAGLQEGSWPNLKQRSSLLGAERLVERKRNPDIARDQLDVIAASGLLQDEERLFHVALTRAKQSLFVTAVQRDDEEPSQFFESVEVLVKKIDEALEPVLTEVPRPITAPALVAELRSQLDGEHAKEAASLLRAMAAEGISLADPTNWVGSVPLSTDAPVIDPDLEVVVSPSGAESFVECGVKWFLQNNGGTDGDSTAQVLGSAIHAFAAKMVQEPGTSKQDLIANLESSWKLIDPESGWVSASHLENAVTMLEKFVSYHNESKREVVDAEIRFDVKLGRARIRGSVDRLEVEADGSLFIIDFKTGGTAISLKDAKENLQLASYQVGIAEGGFAQGNVSAGAELVYLGTSTAGATLRPQHVIDVEATKEKLNEIADGMGAATFFATVNKRCKGCPVRKSCPVQNDGRTVIEQ
ncbi:ATP-dependent helicase [Candidatus Planktophila vernalis]|uniref:ATP-dependent helicase n=1 Tax=Candidatus Planktophila vernalis TaxID=1884907 RepID=UPI003CF8B6D0